MKTIKRGQVTRYAFDNRDEICLRVDQGETFIVETDDALTGLIEDDSDNPKVRSRTLSKVFPPQPLPPGSHENRVGPADG